MSMHTSDHLFGRVHCPTAPYRQIPSVCGRWRPARAVKNQDGWYVLGRAHPLIFHARSRLQRSPQDLHAHVPADKHSNTQERRSLHRAPGTTQTNHADRALTSPSPPLMPIAESCNLCYKHTLTPQRPGESRPILVLNRVLRVLVGLGDPDRSDRHLRAIDDTAVRKLLWLVSLAAVAADGATGRTRAQLDPGPA